MSGAISINTYPFYILHFTFYIFYPPPPLSLQRPSAWAPLARSPPRRLLDTLSDRYRTTALESDGRRSLIYHILRFIKEQDL